MSRLSIFNQKTQEVSAIIDIGSGSVGGCLVVNQKNPKEEKPLMVFSTRIQIILGDHASQTKDYTGPMLKSLSQVLHTLSDWSNEKQGSYKYQIRDVLCLLASQWCFCITEKIENKSEKLFLISNHFLEKSLSEAREGARSHIDMLYGDEKENLVLVDEKVQKVYLNGYAISNFYLKNVSDFSALVKFSYTSTDLVSRLEDVIGSVWKRIDIKFSSSSTAAYVSLISLFPHVEEYLLADIASHATEISIVRDGVLQNTISFPHGRNFLIRKFAERLHVVPAVMESFLKIYSKGMADEKLRAKIDRYLGEVKVEWLEAFHAALPSLSTDIILPKTFFLLAGSELGSFFLAILEKEKYSELPFAQEFKIIVLDRDQCATLVTLLPGVKTDPALLMGSIYLHKGK